MTMLVSVHSHGNTPRMSLTVTLRSTGGSLSGVCESGRVDGGGVVAAIRVEVEERLESRLNLVRSTRQGGDDVALRHGRSRRQDAEDSGGCDECRPHGCE